MLKTLICLRKLEFLIIEKTRRMSECGFGIMIIITFYFWLYKGFSSRRWRTPRPKFILYHIFTILSSIFSENFYENFFHEIYIFWKFFSFFWNNFQKKIFFHFLSEKFLHCFFNTYPYFKNCGLRFLLKASFKIFSPTDWKF